MLEPKPAPTIDPTPMPEETKSPQPELSPTPTPSPVATGPAAAITLDNLEVNWVNLTARKELLRVFDTLTTPVGAYEVIAGPNVIPAQIEEEKRLLDIAARMFSGYFKPTKYQVIFFSEKDGAWADQALATYGGGFPNTIEKEIAKSSNGCNFAFATRGKNQTPIYYQCMDTRGRYINDKQTAIHEYFHLVQDHYQGMGKTPCWVTEGAAQYFGMALGVDNADPTGKATLTFTRNLSFAFNPSGDYNLGPNTNLRDKVETFVGFREVMTLLDQKQVNCLPLAAYAVGSILTEVLIATSGFETYMQFVKSFQSESDWKVAFKKVYGLSSDEFYEKAWPYFKERLNLAFQSG